MRKLLYFFSILSILLFCSSALANQESLNVARRAAYELYKAGNYKEALEKYRTLVLDPTNISFSIDNDLSYAQTCLNNLNQRHKLDTLLEKTLEKQSSNPYALWSLARRYRHAGHWGYLIAGEFHRGNHRGGGKYVSSFARDRTRALQLMAKAHTHFDKATASLEKSNFFHEYAQLWFQASEHSYPPSSWRLSHKTDLSQVPDYQEHQGRYYNNTNPGAPSRADGTPIFYKIPQNFESARNDGERWRWMLQESIRAWPERKTQVTLELANFLRSQFGVRSLGGSFWALWQSPEESQDSKKHSYLLHTLSEKETIARLASGVKRLSLPDEFNFIKLYQEVAQTKNSVNSNPQTTALETLAAIFEDRRQYKKAAALWKEAIERFGQGHSKARQKRLDQIVGAWGRFETTTSQQAGKQNELLFRFRNASSVKLTADKINVSQLIEDTKRYLESNPKELDYQKINLQNIGYRLVTQGEKKYVSSRKHTWTKELEAAKNHFDKRVSLKIPFSEAGAYLITAKLAGGNESKIVFWLTDTAIVQKHLSNEALYYIADSRTGKAVENAELTFFGYRVDHIKQKSLKNDAQKFLGRRYNILTKRFSTQSDEDGLAFVGSKKMDSKYQWLVTRAGKESSKGFAFLGFSRLWLSQHYDQAYNETKVYVTTDRPVYRPDKDVKFKLWVRNARYDLEDTSTYANQNFLVRINNPKGETVFEKNLKADGYGGVASNLKLAKDAALGVYNIHIPSLNHHRGGSFRVEEYKKPEFEVSVEAPTEPIALGDAFTAKIKANYYFGAPVTNARVKYKVERTSTQTRWYAPRPWDWLFGNGYWWFSYDYPWYPGWQKWGCFRPSPWWMPQQSPPPELVQENEVEIGEDGTVEVTIDSSLAKELHGNKDHRYTISVEVRDESRRTITGSGQVLATREPYKVYLWLSRGFYQAGDKINAHIAARTGDQKPISGEGTATLYRIDYNSKGSPEETKVEAWPLKINEQGAGTLELRAAEPGQYRLSFLMNNAKGQRQEGAYIFTIRGTTTKAKDFRFNSIEVIPEQAEYKAGDKARIQINSSLENSTVLLFLRPANGVYQRPRLIHLKGKSSLQEINIGKRDMPNFFVEALSIHSGEVHSSAREIIVPPEKRLLKIELATPKERVSPGEEISLKLKIFDHLGEPFSGTAAITVYDKSVEYISGGSNVPDMKEFFWKWRRSHNPRTTSSLAMHFGNLVPKNELIMRNLGFFGESLADDVALFEKSEMYNRSRGLKVLPASAKQKNTLFRAGSMSDMSLSMEADMPQAPREGRVDRLLGADKRQQAKGNRRENQTASTPLSIRKNFLDTAFWKANISTDQEGPS